MMQLRTNGADEHYLDMNLRNTIALGTRNDLGSDTLADTGEEELGVHTVFRVRIREDLESHTVDITNGSRSYFDTAIMAEIPD
jgi:hypothetical protein